MTFTPMENNYFIDFETIDNDTFMIGVLKEDSNGKPDYRVFLTKSLDLDEQKRIFKEMMLYIGSDRTKKIYHWSHAEISYIKKMGAEMPELTLFYIDNDFIDLCEIFKNGIAIKGAFDFKLKNIVNALFKNGLINVEWSKTGPHSGLEAMVQAMKYYTEELDSDKREKMMDEIIEYNRIDCLSLYSIYKLLLTYI